GAYVMRLDPRRAGSQQLVWCTMFDGNGDDAAYDLAVSRDGRVVSVVGFTSSTSGLPISPNAYQQSLRGPCDGFVARLNGATGAVTWCSYLGGYQNDWAASVVHDAGGRLVVSGATDSSTFPSTPGAYNTTYNGSQDLFVAILDPTQPQAQQLVASTFLG